MERLRYLRLTGRQKALIWLTFIFTLLLGLTVAAVLHMKPIVVDLATARTSNAVNRAVDSGRVDYGRLVSFDKDAEGRVTALKSNMAEFNRLQAAIADDILQRMAEVSTTDLSIPIGTLTGSLAVTADAVNNLSDAAGSIVSLISVRVAQKPIDREHPFGHGRIEYLGALGVGALILVMGLELLKSGVSGIITPQAMHFAWVPFLILLFSIAVKGALFFFYRDAGRLIDADSLKAASRDSLSDVLATSAVALSMVIGQFTTFPVDGVMSIIVALLVLKTGFDVVRDQMDTLMGAKTNPELGRQIIAMLNQYNEILGTHDLMIHDYGPGRCVASIHAEVPADANLVAIHEVIDRAESDISRELHIPICIHIDPIVVGDPIFDSITAHFNHILSQQYPGTHIHDLRMVPGENVVNLVFDVAVPPECKDTAPLTEQLSRAAKALDPRYRCVIHYDLDFYNEQ